ncbi:MAG: ester cyclase [Thermoplasmata archaeon]
MSTEGNKAILRRGLLEMWSQGDLSILEELIAPDYIMHDVAGDFRGVEAYKQLFNLYRSAFPDLRFTVDDQVSEGDLVATHWTSSGTHRGELMGIPATGKQTTSMGVTFSRIANDRAVEEWNYWDALGLLQQLGVVPAMGRTDFTWSEPSPITGDPGMPEANKAIAMRYTDEVWNQRELDVLDEIMGADVVSHEATTEHVVGHGLNAMKQGITIYLTAFPDLHSTIDSMIAEGDKVVQRWTATGTNKGELMGMPATGKQATWIGVTIYRFADGKIAELWWAWNALGLLQQLGVVPPMGEGSE